MHNSRRIIEVGLAAGLVVLAVAALGQWVADAARGAAMPLAFWEPNEQVNDVQNQDTLSPNIAVSGSGHAYAVWRDYRSGDSSDMDVYFSYRPSWGSWGADTQVNDTSAGFRIHPSIAVDGAGNAYALWEDDRNGHYDIFFSYRPAGGSWSSDVRLNDDWGGTAKQEYPTIAVDPGGNAYALWTDLRSGGTEIYFSRRPAGGNWSSNERVNSSPEVDSWPAPDIAVDRFGNAYAVWQYDDGSGDEIHFSYRPAGGSWASEVRVNDHPTPAYTPAIAVDGAGNAYAVWVDSRNGSNRLGIYFSYRPAGGHWGPSEQVHDILTENYLGSPDIGVTSAGHAYVVWRDNRHGPYDSDIYFSHRPAGGVWSVNVRVNDDAGVAYQLAPAIAVDSTGNAYAVWEDKRTGIWTVFFSWLSSGNLPPIATPTHTPSPMPTNTPTHTPSPTPTSTPSPTPTNTPLPTPTDTPVPISTLIPPEGGNLTSNDARQSTTIQFPAGAVSETMLVTYAHQGPSPGDPLVGIEHFFDLQATQGGVPVVLFNKPVTLVVRYTDEERGAAIADSLQLYWWDGANWSSQGIQLIGRTDHALTSTTDHFTLFAVLGETNRIYLPVILLGP